MPIRIKRYTVVVTTLADGTKTAYTIEKVSGLIQAIVYTKTDYADGVDFIISCETSGLIIWDEDNVNASKTVYPRAATCDTLGVASLYAATGEPVEDKIPIANERIQIAIAAGGVTKSGTFYIYVES